MSAYQCSAEHIAFICSVYDVVWDNRRNDYMTFITRADLFDILTKANAESVAYRYREPVASYPRTVAFPRIDIATIDANIGAIFKSIACLEYQSCERDDWKDSNAFGLLQGLRDVLLSRLPGANDDGAWGLPVLRPAAPVAVAAVCAGSVASCQPADSHGVGGKRCATEIPDEPSEPQRWTMLVAKGREDCRAMTSANAYREAVDLTAICA